MKIELCAASVEAVQIAKKFDFDRIELCQNLEQGGMTPSPGFIEYALAMGLETHVLIRPRSGGFCYTRDEIEIALRDIVECKNIGAHGVVVGVLNEFGYIDEYVLELMMEKSNGMEVTFHRAFDDCVDWEKGLDVLMRNKVNRVLTSGMAKSAEIGIPILKRMKTVANNSIEIMAGGGINAINVGHIISEVHPDAVHFSGTVKAILDQESLFSESILQIDEKRVGRILDGIRVKG